VNGGTGTSPRLPVGWCHVQVDHAGHVYAYMGVDHWCRGASDGRPASPPTSSLFHVVFLDEDHDLILKSFETKEARDEYVGHFEDYFDPDDYSATDDFWRFGYTPKHVTFEGIVENDSGS
jgi:hypothetical protein